jgi:hypothetical protein
MEIPGKNISTASQTMRQTAIGTALLAVSPKLILPTLDATNRFAPTGGVIPPMQTFTTSKRPKYTRSMLRLLIMGTAIGVTKMTMEAPSIKVPRNNMKQLMIMRMTNGFWEKFKRAFVSIWGICILVNIQLKKDATAMISIIEAVPRAEFVKIAGSLLHLSSL